VYRAYDPGHDRLVAVKLFRLDLPPERVHQLVAELERLIGAGLTHPAIATPLATGMLGVTAYLVTEYVPADSLDIAMRHGPGSSADALRVAADLASALDLAAAGHVTHGVLHPRDVLVSPDATKLIGLGVARALDRVGVPTPVRRPYTAPERTVGLAWDRRADVFSLAAVVYELLWARRLAALGEDATASLTEIAGGSLPRLRAVFARALAEDPGKRFDTATGFADALKAAFDLQAAEDDIGDQRTARPSSEQAALEVAVGYANQAAAGAPAAQAALAGGRGSMTAGAAVAAEVRSPALERSASTADKRRTPAEGAGLELRLPLEPAAGPVEAEARREATEQARYTDVAAVPLNDAGVPPVLPPDLIDAYRAAAGDSLTDTRSRSAISPLAFALVIGVALGFAVGFGVGARSRSADPAADPANASVPSGTAGTVRETGEATPPPPVQPEPSVVGSLLVRSTPPGARVFVDGREYGQTPVTVANLARGAHSVRVARDGYVTDERQVTITSAQRAHSVTVRLAAERPEPASQPAPTQASVPVRPAGTSPAAPPLPQSGAGLLTVESRPAGAQVFIDGRLVGTTPLVLPDVPVGDHALHLDLDGYQRWASAIRVLPSERTRVAASLDR
jgi:serine/threonine-protein kinase